MHNSRVDCPNKAGGVLCAEIRGIPAANDLESFQCFHVCIHAFKELDPIPQFKATAKAGRIPGGAVLTLFLASGAVSTGRPFPTGAPFCGYKIL